MKLDGFIDPDEGRFAFEIRILEILGLESAGDFLAGRFDDRRGQGIAIGNAGGRSESGPRSRISRLTMPRAGRPVKRLVIAVARSGAARALRCTAGMFASGVTR